VGLLSWLRSKRTLDAAISAAQQGKLRHAVSAFEKYLETNPMDWAAWSGLGECQQALGELNAAEYGFRRSLQLNPESVQSGEGLAVIYGERDHDWGRSLGILGEQLKKAREAGVPGFVEISLAWVYHLKGDNDKAAEHFERALRDINREEIGVQEDAQFAGVEYRLGVLHRALKSDTGSAREHLQKAIRLSPESAYARQAQQLIESTAHSQ